jgi:hypothetical protein
MAKPRSGIFCTRFGPRQIRDGALHAAGAREQCVEAGVFGRRTRKFKAYDQRAGCGQIDGPHDDLTALTRAGPEREQTCAGGGQILSDF